MCRKIRGNEMIHESLIYHEILYHFLLIEKSGFIELKHVQI